MKVTKRWVGLTLVALALLVSACGASAPDRQESLEVFEEEGAYVEEAPAAEFYADNAAGEKAVADVPDRMIIYNGHLDLVVKDTQAAQDEIAQLVDRLEGYIFSSDSYRYQEGLLTVTISLRVPAGKFNEAMTALREMAIEVTRDSVSTEDVTQEYVDLESRLRALEVKAERLEELMDEAEDTEAVLEVYRELSATQQEIEEVKGRMQYLERSAAMATITVSLTPDELSQPIEVAGWRPQGTLKRAFQALIHAYQFLFDALIWILILGVPVLGAIALVIFLLVKLIRLVFRRRGNRPSRAKTKTPPASPEA